MHTCIFVSYDSKVVTMQDGLLLFSSCLSAGMIHIFIFRSYNSVFTEQKQNTTCSVFCF